MVFGPIHKAARAVRGKKVRVDNTFIEDARNDLTEFFILKGMKPDNAVKAAGETINRYKERLGEVF
jgi:hypothetical protein